MQSEIRCKRCNRRLKNPQVVVDMDMKTGATISRYHFGKTCLRKYTEGDHEVKRKTVSRIRATKEHREG